MYIHVELPPITDDKVNFQEAKIVRGSSLPIAKQLHGQYKVNMLNCCHWMSVDMLYT